VYWWKNFIGGPKAVATLDANHFVTDSMQSITASTKKLPASVEKSVSAACHGQSMCQARRSGYQFEVIC
jgi:hypothetical protein